MSEKGTTRRRAQADIKWIDSLPEDWSVFPLLAVCRQNSRSNAGLRENNLLSLSYGNVIRRDINSHDGLLPESFDTYQIVEPGDIVFRLTDLQNDKKSLRTALVSERGIITSAYLSVRVTDANPRFLSYLMRDIDARKVLYSMGGGLRQSMKFDDVKRLPIQVPPRPEQAAIADFLDRETGEIDAFIRDQEMLIALLQERRAATISHAVTEGLEPATPRSVSDTPFVPAFPSHWSVLNLRRLGISQSSGTSVNAYSHPAADGEVGVLTTASVSRGYFDPRQNKRVLEGEEGRVTVPVKAKTLIVNRANTPELVGRTGYVASAAPGLFLSDKLWSLEVERAESRFLYYWSQTPGYRNQLASRATGASSSMQNIAYGDYLDLTLALPPRDEQLRIAEHLERVLADNDAVMRDASEGIRLSHERRRALISAAVTGKIDVRKTVGV